MPRTRNRSGARIDGRPALRIEARSAARRREPQAERDQDGAGDSLQRRSPAWRQHAARAADELVTWFAPPDGFHKAFCSACGSALFSRPPDGEEPTGVRLGAFDADPGVRPARRQFVAYAAAWESIPDDGLPRYPEGPPR